MTHRWIFIREDVINISGIPTPVLVGALSYDTDITLWSLFPYGDMPYVYAAKDGRLVAFSDIETRDPSHYSHGYAEALQSLKAQHRQALEAEVLKCSP